jgi:hypothetical protein
MEEARGTRDQTFTTGYDPNAYYVDQPGFSLRWNATVCEPIITQRHRDIAIWKRNNPDKAVIDVDELKKRLDKRREKYLQDC